MRLFRNMAQAIPSIKRDLSKALVVHSSGVQHNGHAPATAHEAMNYSYTLSTPAPVNFVDYYDLFSTSGINDKLLGDHKYRKASLEWAKAQLRARTNPDFEFRRLSTELGAVDTMHPALSKMAEGNHYGYLYSERLEGLEAALIRTLGPSGRIDSRRMLWPIFQPMDARRAYAQTRVPCSIAYHFMVREVPMVGPALHMTYLQRSSDFERFWLSDVWLAQRIQAWAANKLNLKVGAFSHNILSFHWFKNKQVEIY